MAHTANVRPIILALCFFGVAALGAAAPASGADALPSWNDGPTKQSILTFVRRVTTPGTSDFVAVPERVAVFDNDGTLWAEKPFYSQALFVFDRIHELAPQHPEWRSTQPYKSVLSNDQKALAGLGAKDLTKLVSATHSDMTPEEFSKIVNDWLARARHPRTQRPYTSMIYQPMVELLSYLHDAGFKTYVVTGGGQDFLRAWAERVYGVPPEHIIGSQGELAYELRAGVPTLVKRPGVAFVDDGPGKPIAIQRVIGRRPILAIGNSDGDEPMLAWTVAGSGARFVALVHHTDAEREWAYDRVSSVGKLDKALDEAKRKGWTLFDMKSDWRVIFPPEAAPAAH